VTQSLFLIFTAIYFDAAPTPGPGVAATMKSVHRAAGGLPAGVAVAVTR
jgi:hypothetical protein